MDPLPSRVAVLHGDGLTDEQRAAADWCAERAAVEPVPLADVAAGRVDLAAFDVCWWHRDRPLAWLDEPIPAGAADAVDSYLEAGGGLLLTLHALSAVVPLGIDPVAPDATGTETPPGPHGYLAKAVHVDHPAFEAFPDPAVHTRAADADTALARYESVLPARGQVLAGGVRGDEVLPGRKPLVEWRVGDGRVVGAGTALAFDDVRDMECGAAAGRLVSNLLAVLAGSRAPAFTDRPAATGAGGAGFAAVRERLADDHHRPAYHLAAPAGWLNDPNGLIQHDGRYHVFYQYNPGGPYHGSIHWGHAVSDDLLRWEDEPVALSPDPDGPDRHGCWSGCAVVDADGTPTLLYTGGRDRTQLPCLATAADPDLRSWTKDPRNPIIPAAPSGLDVLETDDWEAEFRDHGVWRSGGSWYQVIGSGIQGVGGAALLYRGDALDDWEFVGPLLVGDREDAGAVWECPELLEFGDRQLLHVSDDDRVDYFVGRLDVDEPAFAVESRGRLDHGDFYAPQSMRTDDGRVLTWGWLPPGRDERAQWDAGWSGALSLPRELSLAGGDLRQRPAAELADLRERHVEGPAALAAGTRRPLDLDPDPTPDPDRDGARNAYELRARVRLDPGATLELGTFESPAGTERTDLRLSADGLVVDRSHASHDPRTDASERRLPLDGGESERVHDLHLFVDGSILEAFLDERRCLTTRVYPTRADARGVTLAATGGDVTLEAFDAWTLSATTAAGRERLA
jgi:beta-fructofuranosidase